MPNASNLSPDNRFVGLFVGPKHSGKTCAAASFIVPSMLKGRRAKFLDFDGRIRGLLGAPWLKEALPNIDYDYYPPRTVGTTQCYEKINQDLEVLDVQCRQNQNLYDLLVLDSLTAETFAMLMDAVPLTHKGEGGKAKGKKIGAVNMAGPEDYGFEATATYALMAFLRSLPIPNVIVTAHVTDRFGKADPTDPYSEKVVVGEKLSVRDKIGTNVMIYFDHIFRFDRRMFGQNENFYVQFRGDIACTSYAGLPPGEFDITGKNFYEFMQEKIRSADPRSNEVK